VLDMRPAMCQRGDSKRMTVWLMRPQLSRVGGGWLDLAWRPRQPIPAWGVEGLLGRANWLVTPGLCAGPARATKRGGWPCL